MLTFICSFLGVLGVGFIFPIFSREWFGGIFIVFSYRISQMFMEGK